MNIDEIETTRMWHTLFVFRGMFIHDDGGERCAAEVIVDFEEVDRNNFTNFCNDLFRDKDVSLKVGDGFLIEKEGKILNLCSPSSIVHFDLGENTESFYKSISYVYYCLYGSCDAIKICEENM